MYTEHSFRVAILRSTDSSNGQPLWTANIDITTVNVPETEGELAASLQARPNTNTQSSRVHHTDKKLVTQRAFEYLASLEVKP